MLPWNLLVQALKNKASDGETVMERDMVEIPLPAVWKVHGLPRRPNGGIIILKIYLVSTGNSRRARPAPINGSRKIAVEPVPYRMHMIPQKSMRRLCSPPTLHSKWIPFMKRFPEISSNIRISLPMHSQEPGLNLHTVIWAPGFVTSVRKCLKKN